MLSECLKAFAGKAKPRSHEDLGIERNRLYACAGHRRLMINVGKAAALPNV